MSIAGLVTPMSLGAFVFGVVVTMAYYRLKCWLKDRQEPDGAPHARAMHLNWLIGAMAVLAIVYIGVKTQQTYDMTTGQAEQAKVFARQVQDCQRDFNAALKARSNYSDKEDQFASEERDALNKWLTTAVNPPPEVAKLPTTDPIYQRWALDITQDYLANLKTIEDQRQKAVDDRNAHPLPEPACGH